MALAEPTEKDKADYLAGMSEEEDTYGAADNGADVGQIDTSESDEDPVVVPADAAAAETEGDESDGESESEESDDAGAETGAAGAPTKLEVECDDGDGKRVVSVDLADHDKLKRIIQRAAGSQKVSKKLSAAEAKIAEIEPDAEIGRSLSKAWADGGIDGVIRALSGGKQTWDSVYEERKKHDKFLASATPEQLDAYNARLAADQAKSEADAAKKQLDEHSKKLTAKEEAAEKSTLQSYLDSGFDKFRFAGKLGDAALEQDLDEMLWDGAIAYLNRLPDDVVVNQKTVADYLARKSAALRKTVAQETRKETKKVVTQKSREAKTQAQAAMVSAQSGGGGTGRGAEAQLRRGNERGAFLAALLGR